MHASLTCRIPKDWNVFPEAMAVANVPSFVRGNAADHALLEQLKLNDENEKQHTNQCQEKAT